MQLGDRVTVHLNLTKGCYVISTKPKGIKLGEADQVTLTDVTFKVSEAQRQYCIRKGGRWVHAWAIGTLVSVDPQPLDGLRQITYNPFRAPSFHYAGEEHPIYEADRVTFSGRYGYVA